MGESKLNKSLSKFKNLRRQLLIIGAIALGLGAILGLANGGSTPSSTWQSPSDTTYTSYDSYDACYTDWDNCVEVKGTPTAGSVSQGLFAAGFSSLGGGLLSLALVAHFLIFTSESIVEGMGGNITTEDPNASKESKKGEEPKV